MKPAFSILLLFISVISLAQTKPASKKLGNPAQVQNMVSGPLANDTCLTKEFSIVVYLMDDTLNPYNNASLNTYITNTITPRINALNNVFRPICVSFKHCKTVVIPNYDMNVWGAYEEIEAVSNWYMDNTINYYLPSKLILTPTCPEGFTYRPDASSANSKKNLIVSGGISIHMVAHFFGLPDTYENVANNPGPAASSNSFVTSKELVNRSNCYVQGDGFCDTEADPYPVSGQANTLPLFRRGNCNFDGNVQDINGEFYTPPLDNYMAHYASCACRFTQEQYNHMVKSILRYRMYLH